MNSNSSASEIASTPPSGSPARSPWSARIPFKLMLATIALSIAVEEFYPFSWFPMFTNLEKKTYYVYVTDGADQRLPMVDEFGWTGDRLDNFFKARLKKLRAQNPDMPADVSSLQTARVTVERLLHIDRKKRPAGTERTLKLWRTDVFARDGDLLAKDTEIVALDPREIGDTSEIEDEGDR